jgi:hypothetical protein
VWERGGSRVVGTRLDKNGTPLDTSMTDDGTRALGAALLFPF